MQFTLSFVTRILSNKKHNLILLMYFVSFSLFIVFFTKMYTHSLPVPIGWDTPVYIFKTKIFSEYGVSGLTSFDTYKAGYYILGNTLLQMMGVDYLTLYTIYPIILSILILYVIIAISLEKKKPFILTPVIVLFWIVLYRLRETIASLLPIFFFWIIFYLMVCKKMDGKYYSIVLLFLIGLFMSHFHTSLYLTPILALFVLVDKSDFFNREHKKTIINIFIPFILLLAPYVYAFREVFFAIFTRVTTGSNWTYLEPFTLDGLIQLVGILQLGLMSIGLIYLVKMVLYSKMNKKIYLFLIIWISWVLLFLIAIIYFDAIKQGYQRYLFISPIPILMSIGFYSVLKSCTKKVIPLVILLIITVSVSMTVTYISETPVWIELDMYEKLETLEEIKVEKSIVPAFPITSRLGNWVLATHGDFVFYGTIDDLLQSNQTYNANNLDTNEKILNYKSKFQLIINDVYLNDRISDEYTIYIVEGIYDLKKVDPEYLEEVLPGIYIYNMDKYYYTTTSEAEKEDD